MNPQSRREEFQRQERIRMRLARASFRLEMAELERIWAIVWAHREGLSVRDIAQQVGLGPTRVHQFVTSPQADCVEHALSVLQEVGWPAPEDPNSEAEEQAADRLIEEAAALVSCVEWLESLATGGQTRGESQAGGAIAGNLLCGCGSGSRDQGAPADRA